MNKNARARILGVLLGAGLALGSWTSAAFALDSCQNACVEQHYGKVSAEVQSLPPAGMDRAAYREQVLADLKRLNDCLAACKGTAAVSGTSTGMGTDTAGQTATSASK